MRKTMLVLASVALAMVVLGGVAWAATIQCPGVNHGFTVCKGTKKADTMIGNFGKNAMQGKKGGDTMYGRGAFDEMTGGPGSVVCRSEAILPRSQSLCLSSAGAFLCWHKTPVIPRDRY